MIGRDLNIFESGEGGDVILTQNDLEMTNAIFNQIYLAWFGGNIEANHEDPEERTPGEQRYDYWQNELFYKDDYEFHLNSILERELGHVAMTSQGIYEIEQAALEDLEFLEDYGDKELNVSIIDADKISLELKMQEPETGNNIEVKFVYDATKQEVIEKRII